MLKLYVVSIQQEVPKQMYEQMLHSVPSKTLERLKRFHFHEDMLRSLYGQIIVRSKLMELKQINNEELTFSKNKFGKPFLSNVSNIYFNISHSGTFVVVAISNQDVGIDVEQIKSPNLDIAKRFFTKQEYEDLRKKQEKEQKTYFYDLWTLKESYVKWIGKGLSIPMDSFSFAKEEDTFYLSTPNEYDLHFYTIPLDVNYRLSVCTPFKQIPTITYITWDEPAFDYLR